MDPSHNALLDLTERLCLPVTNLQKAFEQTIQAVMLKRTPPTMTGPKNKMNFDVKPLVDSYKTLEVRLFMGYNVCDEVVRQLKACVSDVILGICDYVHSDLEEFWENSRRCLEEIRKACIKNAKEIYELEIERTRVYVGCAHDDYLSVKNNEKDEVYDQMVKTFYRQLWLPWAGSALLVAEYEPESLVLDQMLDKTDALHIVFYHLFSSIVGDIDCGHLYVSTALDILKKGFPGPEHLYKEGVMEGRFSAYNGRSNPFIDAQIMLGNTAGYSFFKEPVYKRVISKCARNMIPTVVELYVDMRRSLVETLNWFFGKYHLRETVGEALGQDLGLMFTKCLEFNRRSHALIKQVQEAEDVHDLKMLLSDQVASLFLEFQGLESTFYHMRNEYLKNRVMLHYNLLKKDVVAGMSSFASEVSTILSSKGTSFISLPESTRTDMINLLLCVNEYILACKTAISEMSSEPLTSIKLVRFSDMPKQFKEVHQCILRNLRGLHKRPNAISRRDIYLSLPLNPEVKMVSGFQFHVEPNEGWNPNLRDETMSSHVIKEEHYLTSEKPNPAADSLMNDETFRQLFSHMRNMSFPKTQEYMSWSILNRENDNPPKTLSFLAQIPDEPLTWSPQQKQQQGISFQEAQNFLDWSALNRKTP